jgi:hypothetical protein
MGRFRALLIGIAEYDDPSVRPLSFVLPGLSDVAAALESRGCVTEPGPGSAGGRVTKPELLTSVQHFIDSGRRGDTLLIFVSSHGSHSQGVDYLIPSDASSAWPQLAVMGVALDSWAPFVENTPAAAVVFLIDACREGFDEYVMGGFAREGWPEAKALAAARRNVAYVFACPPGGVARYVAGDEGFSLFARAFQLVAADPGGPSTLSDLQVALDLAMRNIAAECGKPVQEIRVWTDADRDAFAVLPPGRGAAERDSWLRLAADHPAWACAAGGPAADEIHALTMALVEHLAAMRQEALWATARDPWRDTGFARRMTERVGFLLADAGRPRRDGPGGRGGTARPVKLPELWPAEAALLVTMPLMYETHWAVLAARYRVISPGDLCESAKPSADRASFERFAGLYPKLLRRAKNGSALSAEHIGWWLFHRWLVRRPESYSPGEFESLLGPSMLESGLAADIFAGRRLSELTHCIGTDPGFLGRTDRPSALVNRQPVAALTPAEQDIRERLVGYLLAIAGYLAIDVRRLPEIIGDHLGISDPVSPDDLRSMAATARWERRGAARVLRASCRHPAAEVALRRHVLGLDDLLGDAHRLADSEIDLAPLRRAPVQVTADRVGPEQVAGRAAYTSAGVRFRLAEDRIQELLMGEQLYGDKTLAIREMYQNALDACRYRQARTEYLRRAKGTPLAWRGRVRFEQGIDEDKRPYLDCSDNGIGMRTHDLANVFAQAGTRFAELPEFLEEQAEWAALSPPVELYPNSRFGIGVLSYFMLAEEITVTTCRLGRDGNPTERLQVSIAGPGSLFRIRSLGPGTEAGTTVRLHLLPDQDDLSCVNVLREILWVAQFETSARDATATQVWPAGELSPRPAAEDASDVTSAQSKRASIRAFSGRSHGAPVWWCRDDGMILTDGIASDTTIFGAVVNLTGPLAPTLSVNRRNIIGYRKADVEILLRQAAPDVAARYWSSVTFDWLGRLADQWPDVADIVAQNAIDAGRTLDVEDVGVDLRAAGYCRVDSVLLGRRGTSDFPDWLAAWRATACGLAGSWPRSDPERRPIPALPSDTVVISHDLDGRGPWLDPAEPVRLGHVVLVAALLQRAPAQAAARLALLGFIVPDVSALPAEIGPDDASLISEDLDGTRPWLDPDEEVPLARIVESAARLHRTPAAVAERLALLGFVVPDVTALPAEVDPDDATLLRDLMPEAAALVPLGDLVRAAARLRRAPAEVAERLAVLGFAAQDVSALPAEVSSDDAALISQDLDGTGPWLDAAVPVSLDHVLRAAARLRRAPAEVARRLAALGFAVGDVSGLLAEVGPDDITLMSRDVDGTGPWLDAAVPVPVGHVIRAAAQLRRAPAEVAGRLAALGFAVGDVSGLPAEVSPDDAALMSRDLDGTGPWLDAAVPVPLGHVVRVAAQLRRAPAEVAERLALLGFAVGDVFALVAEGSGDDADLISEQLDGTDPWLNQAVPVPLGHVVRAAARLRRAPALVAERLAVLGFAVPDVSALPAEVGPDDVTLISAELDGEEPWLDPAVPVPLGHVVRVAARRRRAPTAVAERLAVLGFAVPDVSALPAEMGPDDVTLISAELDGDAPWLDPVEPVRLSHVVRAAAELRRRPEQVAERLAVLGFAVPDVSALPAEVGGDDLTLISRDLDAVSPWLDPAETVPLAHVIRAAARLRRTPTEVAAQLARFGFSPPSVSQILPRFRPGGP